MKAILTLTLAVFFLILTSCSSSDSIHVGGGKPIGPFIFMVGQTSDNLFSFSGSDSGAIAPLATASTGHAPSAVALQSLSTFQMNLFVAGSASNNVAVLSLDPASGRTTPIGAPVSVGTNPMALSLRGPAGTGSPDFGALYVLNQGSNTISGFHFTDAGGHMTEVPGSPFATKANPQTLAVATFGTSVNNVTTFVYVANGSLGTISGFKVNGDDSLTELAGSPFPAGANITALAERQGGNILLASDAGNNQLLGFAIQSNGALTALPGSTVAAGSRPGPIMFTGSDFVYVANQGSGNISAYKFDFAGKTLSPIAGSPFTAGANPVAFGIARPQQLYVANQGSSDITAFNIDFNTGSLTPVAGSPFHVATAPSAIETLFVMNVD